VFEMWRIDCEFKVTLGEDILMSQRCICVCSTIAVGTCILLEVVIMELSALVFGLI
jgi:hypothetical protein